MKSADPAPNKIRDFSTVSPSAKSLLLRKGYTDIPFARQAAELISSPGAFVPDFANRDPGFWARTVHFEIRYWSIDQLLKGLPVKNILELSSGFSFRGLETIRLRDCHYIDTDLPGVIAEKKRMLESLRKEKPGSRGSLELLPLNALDENQFSEIVRRFPAGQIAIVNEGLMMYLEPAEKNRLCGIIHKILKERGGWWITADIYVKHKVEKLEVTVDDRERQFFQEHRIEENKFDSFKAAESFFREAGFVIDKEAKIDPSALSTLPRLLKNISLLHRLKLRMSERIQATWRLRVSE